MKVSSGLSVHLLYCQAGVSAPTKKIDIFCMMMSRSDRQYPMTVVVLSSAKIFQLIGLICWQYTIEGRQPPLRFPSLIISYLPEPNRKNFHLSVISRRYYFTSRRGAKYCILHFCVSVCMSVCMSVCPLAYLNKNSSGDEIANVNFCTTTTYICRGQCLRPLNRLANFYFLV